MAYKWTKEELEDIIRMYCVDKKNTYEIAEKYDVIGPTISTLLRDNKIEIRTLSVAKRTLSDI